MPPDQFTPSVPDIVAANARFAAVFRSSHLAAAPSRRLVVVACMDCRLDIRPMLGLGEGEAHIIRNAGGVVTDDVIRSVCLSQQLLRTREIVLVHHTDCGLQSVSEEGFKQHLKDELGVEPEWSIEAFTDPVADVRSSIRKLALSPFVAGDTAISGFVYDVATGLLAEVAGGDPHAG